MGKASTRKRNAPPRTAAERRDNLDLLTDETKKAALERRRQVLVDRLADIEVDKLMPDYKDWSEERKRAVQATSDLMADAIRDIDRRFKGASDLLWDYSGREPKEPEATE